MNEKKFIQLLNLYIDGEATPPEAREVELEIENDPARRRVYDDYRRIQAATRALYAQFRRDDAGTTTQADPTGRNRAAGVRTAAGARPGRASGYPFRRALFWAGGAVAACLALALSFWSLPRIGGGAPEPVQVVEATGLSVPTIERAATAVAASTPSTYTAPFTSAMRVDPYLIGNTLPPGDPFSLTSSPRQNAFGDPDLVLSFPPALASFTQTMDTPSAEAERLRKLQSILRREQPKPDGKGQFVPVNLRQQP
ncbi:MAG: zf-HC2 domain-containing protein [Opitutaceae bacterium]|nr:zf-HC2 domain-containing protein [Opitutaceae bacterium]